jgi:ABC-type branched-subunit amino acid transport system ATPase component/branched-subunit amino acid ABC-type transport system permease component
MSDLMPFIVTGIVAGSVYGLAGVGLVLTYRTSRIFNFAYGAIGTIGAYLFYVLWSEHHVPWPIAALCSTVVISIPMGFGFGKLSIRLSRRELPYQVATTVGISLTIQSIFLLMFSNTSRTVNEFLPKSTFELGGANVQYSQLITVLVALLGAGGLFALLKFSRLGKSMRAVVDDGDLLDLSGTSPDFVRSAAWMIGCGFATLSGILIAPTLPLAPETLTLLVVQAFGAAAIGRFVSLPWTLAGGIMLGLGSSILTKYLTTTSIWGGLTGALPFVVLFLVLVFAPRRWSLQQSNASLVIRDPALVRAPMRVQVTMAVVVLAFLAVVPSFVGFRLFAWSEGLATVVLLVSLAFLTRLSGQVSLCQATFAAVGAVALTKFVHAGVPWLLALLLAGMVAVPIGVVIAIPAIRHGGLFLALATFGLATVVESMFYETWVMFGSSGEGVSVPAPKLSALGIGSDKSVYYVILILGALIILAVVALERSRLGRLLAGLRDSPGALTAGGTSVNLTRVLVFCISAFVAGIAGALYGVALTNVDGPSSFSSTQSLLYFAVIMITVGGIPWNALLPGMALVLIPIYIQSSSTSDWLSLLFGASAIFVGIGARAEPPAWITRFSRGKAKPLPDHATLAAPQGTSRREPTPAALASSNGSAGLRLTGVTVDFRGLRAVDGASMVAPAHHITGLIGPNGAGKTTLFNVCSGLVQPTEGTVELNDVELTRLSPSAIARAGLGRTFQHLDLFESMSVRDNVELGCESVFAGADLRHQVVSSTAEKRQVRERTDRALDLCGIATLANTPVGSMPTGQRRLVEVARTLAGDFGFVLLDEPSAGLSREETDRFADIVRCVAYEWGWGVVVVEHDVPLVMSLCETIYVLDFGKMIFRGNSGELRNSAAVREAYLGNSDTQIQSGVERL